LISLYLIITYILYSLNGEVQSLPDLDKDNSHPYDSQLAPLIKATRGEKVDLTELKNSLATAIKVTQDKLNSSGNFDEILSKARLALLNDSAQT
jgi:hypothetical protein